MDTLTHLTLEDVRAAAARLEGTVHRTPLLRLPLAGEVYAKAENLQRTGSFKLRGALNFLASLPEAVRARGVVAHSSGNHAQGVACAAALFGVPATIVIPEGASEVKVARTEAYGARVVRCALGARERVAYELAEAHGWTLVPPFDHPWIIAGQGTAGLELAQALPEVADVLVPLGGGGLLAGVALAVRALAPQARVWGVEPEVAADGKASLAAGCVQPWPPERTARTVADGVRTPAVGRLNFRLIRELVTDIVTVSETAIVAATRWYASEAKLVVEPTGALTLAALHALRERGALGEGPTVLLVSGGNIGAQALGELLRGAPPTDA
jgi:threonine dehydratase